MMGNAPALFDAICEGWTKCLTGDYGDGTFSAAVDGMTDCNRFVDFVCQQMGYKKFVPTGQNLPILANKMLDFMENSVDWKEVNGTTAQWYANIGVLVVAGWKDPNGGHGHVCIVRPGKVTSSGKWGSNEVPKVANVGPSKFCRIDRGANWAFADEPKYYALKEMF